MAMMKKGNFSYLHDHVNYLQIDGGLSIRIERITKDGPPMLPVVWCDSTLTAYMGEGYWRARIPSPGTLGSSRPHHERRPYIHSATAVYSGSTNGAYLPAQVMVAFAIPNNCQQNAKQDLVNHVVDSIHEIIGADSSYGYSAQTGTFTAGKSGAAAWTEEIFLAL
ncbi:hypothetical protein WJX75_006991 [Coccomyxa subellipsoidea]|uniref:Uncharacterized protein n=1 Tax=Coccomyxa subellipsoidea TaxID=248742 RepID=A0ABR2YCD2_9CHLO